VLVGGDVDKFEIEEEDGSNPLVDGGIWLYVRVAEHTSDVACIYFNYKVADANDIKMLHS